MTQHNLFLKSTFALPRMDCASEERMVRMALDGHAGVKSLTFDLSNRKLVAIHTAAAADVLAKLQPLGLGARLEESAAADPAAGDDVIHARGDAAEARVLHRLFIINGAMFLIELAVGVLAQSTGLIADSLDMFADAAVLALSFYAVGRSNQAKNRAAHVAGWLQLVLALGALGEVFRRFVYGSEPASMLMVGMGAVALVANAYCLWAMARHRDRGAHLKASYIFLANDVIANAGVILAGVLVAVTSSPYPDLMIGTIVALVVLNGARRILALK